MSRWQGPSNSYKVFGLALKNEMHFAIKCRCNIYMCEYDKHCWECYQQLLCGIHVTLISVFQTLNGNVEAKVMCFYRRRDISSSLISLADKHQSKYTSAKLSTCSGLNSWLVLQLCLRSMYIDTDNFTFH